MIGSLLKQVTSVLNTSVRDSHQASTTEANYYAYFVINGSTHDLYLIPVERIKELIAQGGCKKMNGGDGYRSRFYLIPKAVFAEYITKRKVEA